MTALLLTACVGMITGAFLIFRISPMDFTLGVFRRLTAGPKSIRDEINETTQRKSPASSAARYRKRRRSCKPPARRNAFPCFARHPCCSLPWVRASPSS